MPPQQTDQEIEDALMKRYGGVRATTPPPTLDPIEEALMKRFGGTVAPPKPRTELDAIRERMAARMSSTPPPDNTFAGAYSAGTNTLSGLWDLAKSAVTHPIDTAGNLYGSLTGSAGAPRLTEDIKTMVSQPSQEQALQTLQSFLGVLPLGIGSFATKAREQLSDTSKPLTELLPPVIGEGAALATNLALTKPTETARAAHAAGAPARAAAILAAKERNYVRLMKQAHTEMDAGNIKTTVPYMAEEHAATPIATIDDLVAAKDRAIGKIETYVQSAVDHFPNEIVQVPVRDIEDALDRGLRGPTTPAPRGMGTRATDIEKGMKAIETLELDRPMTLPDLYERLLRLNAELRKALSESKYDVAAMRQSDPAFRAIELAAEHARKIVYERLDQLGVSDVAKLRADEGALIETRNAAYSKRFQGEAPVRPPGGISVGQQIANQVIKRVGRVVGAVTGDTVEGAINRLQGGAKPRNVVIERATRNLEGLQGPGFPPLPGPLPTVNIFGGPGGPGGPPAGPGLPPGPPPPGLPPGVPPPRLGLPPIGGSGQPPPGTPPLALPPAPPRQLGPAVREMPAPGQPPDYRAPRIPPQVLPTTWDDVERFYQGEDTSRGLQQQPNIISDILSLPPEERAAAIAELERSTPPPEPPDTYTRPGTPPTPPSPPAGPTPAGTANALVEQFKKSVMATGVSDIPLAEWRTRLAQATPEDLQALAAHLEGSPSSWATKNLLPEVNKLLSEPTKPVGSLTPDAPSGLLNDVQASLQKNKNGTSDRGLIYWRQQFAAASLDDLNALASWLAGPDATPWARKTLLPDVMKQVRAAKVPKATHVGPNAPTGPKPPLPAGTPPRPVPDGRRPPARRGGPARPEKTGVDAIPPALAEHFDELLRDAPAQGFQGTPDELAAEYLKAVEQAKRDQQGMHPGGEHGDVEVGLLKAIADAGGISLAEAGMRDEVRGMMEQLAPRRIIQKGARKGQAMPLTNAGVPGAANVFRAKGGLTLDYIREALNQVPQFEGRFDNLPDLLDAIERAVNVATGHAKPTAEGPGLRSILEHQLGVQVGYPWWAF